MYSKVKPKKSFGQNFLVDNKVVADLVTAANLTGEDVVSEVGAGTGVVTKELAKQAGEVFAFEIDRDLAPVLQEELQEFYNVEIINEDILKLEKSISLLLKDNCRSEAKTILQKQGSASEASRFLYSSILSSQFKIVGSIPYQITSPLIHKIITFEPLPSLVVLLIQKEVAEKITAQPPKATYLSNIIKLLGEVELVRLVPKTAFWPSPKVEGAIIKIVRSCDPCGRPSDIENFQKFLHKGFQNPRKMLRTKFASEVLENVGIDPTRRAQTLELDEWVKVFNHLND